MFYKKKTKEEKMEFRVNSVLQALTSENDFVFTELETVQMLNEVRRKLSESINQKRSDCLSKSTDFQQKAKELESVLDLFE